MIHFLLIILISLGILTGVGCKNLTTKNKIENIFNPNDTMPAIYSKKDIEKMLLDLSKSNPKNLESMGAMCYDMAAPPQRAEYICPICGEKTLYENNYTTLISWELQQMRELVNNIKSISCKLDESQFCRSCSPKIINPELCLIVNIEEKNEHKTCNIDEQDVILLNEFLSGSKIHKTFNDAEQPLKQYLPRIEELLGIKL